MSLIRLHPQDDGKKFSPGPRFTTAKAGNMPQPAFRSDRYTSSAKPIVPMIASRSFAYLHSVRRRHVKTKINTIEASHCGLTRHDSVISQERRLVYAEQTLAMIWVHR